MNIEVYNSRMNMEVYVSRTNIEVYNLKMNIKLYSLIPVPETLSNKIFLTSDLDSYKGTTLYELNFTGKTSEESLTIINDFIKGCSNKWSHIILKWKIEVKIWEYSNFECEEKV